MNLLGNSLANASKICKVFAEQGQGALCDDCVVFMLISKWLVSGSSHCLPACQFSNGFLLCCGGS